MLQNVIFKIKTVPSPKGTVRHNILKDVIMMFFFFTDDEADTTVPLETETNSKQKQQNYSDSTFESIKHINDYGQEFWYARELQIALEYKQWRRFCGVIDKAKEACKNSGYTISDHFADIGKMVDIGSSAHREIQDFELSRYACYLIVMNGDSSKEIIALGQTYFAVKTRQQELIENFDDLTEDKKRLAIRGEMITHNKSLAEAAKMAGISDSRDYAIFQNCGYQGLYGGLGVKDIHKRKGLKKSQKILDHMGSTELAANLFRATQTDEKLRREQIQGKKEANQTHYEVGKKVGRKVRVQDRTGSRCGS